MGTQPECFGILVQLLSCICRGESLGTPQIKCPNKRSQQHRNRIQDAAFTLAITCHQHRQILLERYRQVFEATEVLDVKLFDQHDRASGDWSGRAGACAGRLANEWVAGNQGC